MGLKVINFKSRNQFRDWLNKNHLTSDYIYIQTSIKPRENILLYSDLVEECLCYGWIDSHKFSLGNGLLAQKVGPRKSNHFSKLNIERCKKLIESGLMTEYGKFFL